MGASRRPGGWSVQRELLGSSPADRALERRLHRGAPAPRFVLATATPWPAKSSVFCSTSARTTPVRCPSVSTTTSAPGHGAASGRVLWRRWSGLGLISLLKGRQHVLRRSCRWPDNPVGQLGRRARSSRRSGALATGSHAVHVRPEACEDDETMCARDGALIGIRR